MARETFLSKTFTHKSDVWSYGVFCIEVLTRDQPYPKMTTEEFAFRVLPEKLTPIDQIPSDTPDAIADIVKKCFCEEPEDRPDFQEIFNLLSTQ